MTTNTETAAEGFYKTGKQLNMTKAIAKCNGMVKVVVTGWCLFSNTHCVLDSVFHENLACIASFSSHGLL